MMKALTADGSQATIMSCFLFLGISTLITHIAALTIPPSSSLIEQLSANTSGSSSSSSDIFPLLFPTLNITTTPSSLINANHFQHVCVPHSEDRPWFNDQVQSNWRYDTPCYESMRMFSKEQDKHGTGNFEFLAPDAQATTKLQTMQTPRRYSFGKSTLSFFSFFFFASGPGERGEEGRWPIFVLTVK